MGMSERVMNLVRFEGQDALLIERLSDPLRRALGERRSIERVGRVGEVLVCITVLPAGTGHITAHEAALVAAHQE